MPLVWQRVQLFLRWVLLPLDLREAKLKLRRYRCIAVPAPNYAAKVEARLGVGIPHDFVNDPDFGESTDFIDAISNRLSIPPILISCSVRFHHFSFYMRWREGPRIEFNSSTQPRATFTRNEKAPDYD